MRYSGFYVNNKNWFSFVLSGGKSTVLFVQDAMILLVGPYERKWKGMKLEVGKGRVRGKTSSKKHCGMTY